MRVRLLVIALLLGVLAWGGAFAYRSARPNTSTNLGLEEALSKKSELINQSITVTGKVLFESVCPPSQEGAAAQCTIKAYLVNDNETYLQAKTEKLLLYEDGKLVGCTEPIPAEGCNGWISNGKYTVIGKLEYLVAGGRQTDTLVLAVSSKRKF